METIALPTRWSNDPLCRGFGLIAAAFTPFTDDGELNLAIVEKQAESLIAAGLRGAFVCGTTGEGVSMTDDERVQLARRWCEVAKGQFEVIVHVGHTSAPAARDLAAQAERDGATGVAAMGPFFFKPDTPSDLAEFCALVASGAPALPFYYYHLPSLSRVNMSMAEFLPIAAARIPTFRGIKFTHSDLVDYGRCVAAAGDRHEVFFGTDEMLLAGLAMGARSAVGSTYNFALPLYHRMISSFARGDFLEARQAQLQVWDLICALLKFAPLPAQKRLMKWVGIDCGPCRPPLRDLSDEEGWRLRIELERIGAFQSLGTT